VRAETSPDPVRILLVEDNPGDAGLIELTLEETRADRYQIEHVDRLSKALARVSEVEYDLVLLDLGLPDSNGLDTFAALQATAPDLAVVVLTGNRDESQGSEAVQAGAQDYLVKGAIKGASFPRSLEYAIERHRVQRELRQLNEELEQRVDARTRELGESERKYRTLVDQSLQGIVIAQGERPRLVYANPAMGAILGYAPQELMALDADQAMQVVHPDDRPMFLRTYRRRIQGDPALHFEFRGLRRDGETRWLSVSTARIDYQGSYAVLATFVDVTDRRDAEQALAAEKERLAVTVSSIGDGVIATDKSGRVVLINRAAQELTGWSEADAAGRPLVEVFRCQDPDDRDDLPDPVAQVLQRDEVVGFANDVLLIDRDGGEWMVSRTGAPIRDAHGAPIGVVLGFRDQSDRVLWEEERSRREKAESLGVLADGIAHDFNNILTGILGNVSLAKVHAQEGDGLWKRLSEAERALDQATRLVRQLMSLSRSGSPLTEAASIEEIIEQSASLAMSGSRSRYELVAQDGLWAVKVDTTQISRVVQNLVINAEQAMDHGGLLSIGLSNVVLDDPSPLPLEPGRYVKASFRDEGCGIAPALLTKIFDPYVTTKSSGTGLGLAIAFSNVAQHGGHITLESRVGRGTTFPVYLPASDGPDSREQRVSQDPAEPGSGLILVMDDEPAVKDVCAEMLRYLGYEVETAQDGEEAIDLFQSRREAGRPFDLVITDLTVPGGMGGKVVAERLRRIDPDVQVIAASGYYDDPVMARYGDHGFAGALRKPFTTVELGDVVRGVLGAGE
jgi:two-component system, cell cycle sensor histidine kinase and response regulator CckA